jgi:hypothetical protein
LGCGEFLKWAQPQETGRYELFDGEIVMQASERAGLPVSGLFS